MRTWPLVFCVMLASTPALADEDPTKCELTQSWEDIEGRAATLMIVNQDQKHFDNGDEVLVAFFNDDWSIKKGDTLGKIKITGNDGSWLDNNAISMDNGFLILTTFSYLQNIFGASASSLHITRGGKTIDRLSVTGSFLEWMTFTRCRDKKVAVKTERERKEKLRRAIPQDPFAK